VTADSGLTAAEQVNGFDILSALLSYRSVPGAMTGSQRTCVNARHLRVTEGDSVGHEP